MTNGTAQPTNQSIINKLGEVDQDMRELWTESSAQNKDLNEIKSDVKLMKQQMGNLEQLIDRLVTRHEFNPIRLLVYGMAGTLLAGLAGAILAKVLAK